VSYSEECLTDFRREFPRPAPAYCPGCQSFLEECTPDPEDYNKPCPYHRPRVDEYEPAWPPSLLDNEEEEDADQRIV